MGNAIQLRPLDVRQTPKLPSRAEAQWQWQLRAGLSEQVLSQVAEQE